MVNRRNDWIFLLYSGVGIRECIYGINRRSIALLSQLI